MKSILEYLLGKGNNKLIDEYFIVRLHYTASVAVHQRFYEDYKKNKLYHKKTGDYWVFTKEELLDIINKNDIHPINIFIYEIPDEYINSIEKLKDDINSGIVTYEKLKEIKFADFIDDKHK